MTCFLRNRKSPLLLLCAGVFLILWWRSIQHPLDPLQTESLGSQEVTSAVIATYSSSPVSHERKNVPSSHLIRCQPDHFVIKEGFTLPVPQATWPIHNLLCEDWMIALRKFLGKISPNGSTPISLVSSDSKYEDMLLNWLISATLKTTTTPLSHILVLSLDSSLHRTLERHSFNSIYVDSAILLRPNLLSILQAKQNLAFNMVMILRITVIRLLNHWGYDVASYDIDALVIRNPEELYYGEFSSSDLIGSKGRFPEQVKDVLGITLCAGVFMIKSTPNTENFWTVVSQVSPTSVNDQENLNTALIELHLKQNAGTTSETDYWEARSARGFKVTILNEAYICRRTCDRKKKSKYYLWHDGGKGSNQKIRNARVSRLWYLRNDWAKRAENSSSLSTEWLKELKKPEVIHTIKKNKIHKSRTRTVRN